MRRIALRIIALLAAGALVSLFALPFVALLLRVAPAALLARLGSPEIIAALRLSLVTAAVATLLATVGGVPLAYVLALKSFPGKRALEVLVDLPMVLPPTVAGFALLMAFGRMGLAGRALHAFGLSLPFTTLGVIVAQTFMAAPFFVTAARAGFASVDRRYIDAAMTLRASEARLFAQVLLPLALPSLLAGIAMCAARALGEFGATITFAGNLPGVTQTMPLAVYVALQSDLDAAMVLSVMLLVMSCLLLLGLRATSAALFLGGRRAAGAAR